MSDIRTSSYTTEVIHTHSGYAKGNINKDFLTTLSDGKGMVESKIEQLKAKEQQLYQQFGKTTYEEFIQELRSLFNSNDKKVIERFQANNLNSSLQRFASSNSELLNQEVKIIIDTSKIKNANFRIGNSKQVLTFQGVFTPEGEKGVKNFLNSILKSKLVVGSLNTKRMDELIKELENDGAIQIMVNAGSGGNGQEKWTIHHKSKIPNYPWGITKKDIEDADVWSSVKEDIINAIQRIKVFIFQELGAEASPELKAAMQTVWSNNFGSSWSDPAKFFAGTTKGNFISVVQGSLGEFQTALIFEYLRNRKSVSPAMAQIVGNVYKRGEQGKTDVQIFRSLGIQVKNVSIIENSGQLSLLRDLKTNIHPNRFAQYLDEPASTHFLDFLANYYFNTSYQSAMEARMNQLQYRLSYWLIEITNMAMADMMVADTVSFYMIGGKYLIPCSRLIEASKQLKVANSIEITSSYQGYSDEEYARHTTDPSKKGGAQKYYELYWKKDEDWHPTDKNKSEYYNLISKNISIRTHFNLLQEIENYAIW